MVSMDDVKKLRDETSISIMQCKKALEEAEGDYDKALIVLSKKKEAAAAKKADRELAAGTIGVYQHNGGSVASMVELACETDFVSKNEEFETLARDIAMHISAMNPLYLNREGVDESALEKAKEVFAEEVADKPAEMQDKILEGKINSYFKERILLEQSFIKEGDKTIADLLSAGTQKFGEKIEIVRYVRYGLLEA